MTNSKTNGVDFLHHASRSQPNEPVFSMMVHRLPQFTLSGAQTKYPCPDDGGLPNTVRPFAGTKGVEPALVKLFGGDVQ